MLLLGPLGCADALPAAAEDACTSLAAMAVTDPYGVGTPFDLFHIRTLIDQMSEWTGLDRVCVPEVRLTNEADILDTYGRPSTTLGVYGGEGAPILVREAGVAFHELCHAVDHQLGDLHDSRPDLFASDDPGEELARACEGGPAGLAVSNRVGEACGLDLVDPVDRFLRESFFSGFDEAEPRSMAAAWPFGEPVTVALDRNPENPYIFGAAGSGRHLHLVSVANDTSGGVSAVDDVVDVETGVHVAQLQLLGAPEDGWEVLAGDTSVLILRRGDGVDAWEVADADLTLVEAPFPEISRAQYLTGHVADGVLWMSTGTADDETAYPSLLRQVRPDAALDELIPPDGRMTSNLHATDEGPVARQSYPFQSLAERVVRFDVRSGTTEEVLPLVVGAGQVATLDDGRLLARWIADGADPYTAWLVGEPDAGEWSLVPPDCEDVGRYDWERLLRVGGRTRLLRHTETDGWRLYPTGI